MGDHLKHLDEALQGQHRCLKCRTIMDPFQLFCMKCGSENPEFEEQALEREYKTPSITEVRRKECPGYHSLDVVESPQATKENILDFIRECPFCPHCGINVLKIAIH